MKNNTCRVISISNQKGGVGKTTTAINLSASLSVAGKKSLLIDIDPQGNATSGLGIRLKNGDCTVYDVLLSDEHLDSAIRKTGVDDLDLVPSDIGLTGAEIELVNKEKREYGLKAFVNRVSDRYDFIFIDSPPSLGLLTLNALTAANSVLIPLQCEYYALEGLGHLLNTIKLVRNGLNSSLKLEGILFTMFDTRTSLASHVVQEVKEHFKEKVLDSVIPRNVRLGEAPSHGKPVILYDVHSKGANAYIDLAKELIQKCKGNH
ncbi:MAG: ParA family protein [Nitrospinota bacterium]